MRSIALGLLLMMSVDAAAACDARFTYEGADPGWKVVEFREDRAVTITVRGQKPRAYTRECGGVPALCVLTDDADPQAEPIGMLDHKGDLILDMQVFVPYCADR